MTSSSAAGGKQVIEPGRELAELSEGQRGPAAGAGSEAVGSVYRDP